MPLRRPTLPNPTAAWRAVALAGALMAVCGAAWSQQPGLALAGVLGNRALLVFGNGAPRSVAAGETMQGVKVLAVGQDDAEVEVQGRRVQLRMGDAPVSIGARNAQQRIVLQADSRGHFIHEGRINGQPMRFIVDTGATLVAIGQDDAKRMGLNYDRSPPTRLGTANGAALGWPVRLDSIRVGEIEISGVDAVVTSQPLPYVLLGNSFLNLFQMTRLNDQMVLEKRF